MTPLIADLRSDTVTTPTPSMRKAMAEAIVGDDVYGDDPTVNQLQQTVAQLTGHEAGLFMPSGCMTNQVAIALHTQRGQEVICAEGSHIYEWELGMMAAFSGVVPRFVNAPLGIPTPTDIRQAVRRNIHQSPTGLISLENTHNKAGGTVIPLETMQHIRTVANEENLPLHLDGARAFNAAEALDIPLKTMTKLFDTVSICLSKGLGAPVGSVLTGSKAAIKEARRYRKMLGGGMRQAGVLAAAALIALEEGPSRLTEDHRRSRILAETLLDAGFEVNIEAVQTNIVYATVPQAEQKVEAWTQQGVLSNALDEHTVRFVLHHQIDDEALNQALKILIA